MTQEDLDTFIEEAKEAEPSDEYGPGNERWERRPLSEFIEPVLGKTPKRSEDEYWDGGDIKWASAKDISQSEIRHVYDTEEKMTEAGKEASNAKILPEGNVVVVARGATMGRVAQLGEPMTFNQTCYALDTNDELLDDYLYYAWQYVFGQVQAVSYGTVFDSITMKSFKDIEIPYPPLEDQRRIASALTTIDDRIEVNKESNKALAETAQEIFEHWFVDQNYFSDVETRYIEDMDMEVPVDWQVKEMSEIAKIIDCLHSKKPDEQEQGNFYIEVNDIGENGELYLDDQYLISDEDYDEWTRRITAKTGDVIISKDGKVGAVAQIPERIEGAIGRNLVCIRPDGENLSPPLLREYMLSRLMRQEIGEKTLSRSIFETLHVSEIESLRVVVPPEDIRNRFDEVVKPIHRKIDHNIKESITLEELRDTLLPRLISGEVRLDPENNDGPDITV
jgi:type I restriction enzyme S subunit